MTGKPTRAQLAYLDRAAERISFIGVDVPPTRGHRWSTHHACERRGWVSVDINSYPHVISLTDAGHAIRGVE